MNLQQLATAWRGRLRQEGLTPSWTRRDFFKRSGLLAAAGLVGTGASLEAAKPDGTIEGDQMSGQVDLDEYGEARWVARKRSK
jgi:hypothetical protein